jgi:hypothetical protein
MPPPSTPYIEIASPGGTPLAGADAEFAASHWYWDHEPATNEGTPVIHLTTTNANSANWPTEYIHGVSDVDPGTPQPFIHIDCETTYDSDEIATHEQERRKKTC